MAKSMLVVTGDKKLNRMLAKLGSRDGKKAVRKAARPALRPVLQAAKRNAPHETGALEKSIKIRAIKRSRSRVGARVTTGQTEFQGETYYGGFQEWGWKTGKRGSAVRRQVEGRHFLARSADEKRRSALTIYRRELRKQIVALARRKA